MASCDCTVMMDGTHVPDGAVFLHTGLEDDGHPVYWTTYDPAGVGSNPRLPGFFCHEGHLMTGPEREVLGDPHPTRSVPTCAEEPCVGQYAWIKRVLRAFTEDPGSRRSQNFVRYLTSLRTSCEEGSWDEIEAEKLLRVHEYYQRSADGTLPI